MSRKDKEELIKSWKEGEVAGPAGDVKLDDADLENVSGGAVVGTEMVGTRGCCPTEGIGTCAEGTNGCCNKA